MYKHKKIAILLPDLRGGGAERVAVNLANEFVERGHAVDIVVKAAQGDFLDLLNPSINVIALNSSRLLFIIFPLLRYLRSAKPDALIANMWPLTVIAAFARFFSNYPARLMLVEHTTWSQSELLVNFFIRWQVRTSMNLMFAKADAVLAVSKGAANDLEKFAALHHASVTVIYNPIVPTNASRDSSVVFLPNSTQWCSGSHRKILAVGALKDIKDFETLLKAFALLRASCDARLLILGEGNLRGALEMKIIELQLTGYAFMPGFALDPTPYFAVADLFVLSSIAEGFGNVIVEALAAGTPVVSTDCPSGPREILEEGKYGALVPVGNAEKLAAAMHESLNSTHDIPALKARSLDFSVEKATDAYLSLLFPTDMAEEA